MKALCRHGRRVYSYGTCLIDVLPDGRTLGNLSHYSTTTTRHQTETRVAACEVTVDHVPQGVEDLAAWYLARHPQATERKAA